MSIISGKEPLSKIILKPPYFRTVGAQTYLNYYILLNMPCGMPSLRRPCLPAQTMHESVDL